MLPRPLPRSVLHCLAFSVTKKCLFSAPNRTQNRSPYRARLQSKHLNVSQLMQLPRIHRIKKHPWQRQPQILRQTAPRMIAGKATPKQTYLARQMVCISSSQDGDELNYLDSVFSGWNARSSTTTDSSWGSNFSRQKAEAVQPLSRDSYTTHSTGVTVSPRDSVNEGEQIATVVRISSAGTMPITIDNSPSHPHL